MFSSKATWRLKAAIFISQGEIQYWAGIRGKSLPPELPPKAKLILSHSPASTKPPQRCWALELFPQFWLSIHGHLPCSEKGNQRQTNPTKFNPKEGEQQGRRNTLQLQPKPSVRVYHEKLQTSRWQPQPRAGCGSLMLPPLASPGLGGGKVVMSLSRVQRGNIHQWKAYRSSRMVQTPMTPPRMRESRRLRRLILWIRLFTAGKRSWRPLGQGIHQRAPKPAWGNANTATAPKLEKAGAVKPDREQDYNCTSLIPDQQRKGNSPELTTTQNSPPDHLNYQHFNLQYVRLSYFY